MKDLKPLSVRVMERQTHVALQKHLGILYLNKKSRLSLARPFSCGQQAPAAAGEEGTVG